MERASTSVYEHVFKKFYAKLEEKNDERFTDEERIKLKHALFDLAERIKACAEKIS